MNSRARIAFLMLVLAQAAHSIEEYVFGLYDVFGPARIVSRLVSDRPATGFAIVNAAFVAFGLWCYAARVRPAHPSARQWMWLWVLIELGNGVGHPLLALARQTYFPGLATSPVLLVLSIYLARQLIGLERALYLNLFVLVPISFSLGCEHAWNLANRRAAADDVQALLATHGVDDANPDCRMVDTTRDVTCELEASAEEVSRVVAGLGLRPVDPSSSVGDHLVHLASRRPAGMHCTNAFARRTGVRVYGVTGRPSQLGVPGGAAFEFLLLYHADNASRACAWLSYSYG